MNKEQTPITAEEIKENIMELYDDGDMSYNLLDTSLEQYAQAKVLEALEREVPEAYNEDPNNRDYPDYLCCKSGREYYETQVKPKYE